MKIIMIGLGGAGQRLLRIAYAQLGNPEVIAYRVKKRTAVIRSNFQLDEKEDVESKYNIKVYGDLRKALKQMPEVAIIANPTSEHMKCAIAAADAGCHILIEKPLSHSLDGIKELESAVKKNKIIFMVGYQMRFHPAIQRIKQILEEKKLGDIISATVIQHSYLPAWHPYEDYRQIYAAKKELGGGVILTESHELDYTYWFFGMPKRIKCTASNSMLGLGVEDSAVIELDYGFPVRLDVSFADKEPKRTCEIICEKGKIFCDLNTNKLVLEVNGKTENFDFSGFERIDMFESEVKHFLVCVKKKKKPLISLEDGIASLKIALEAKKSAGLA